MVASEVEITPRFEGEEKRRGETCMSEKDFLSKVSEVTNPKLGQRGVLCPTPVGHI